MKCFNHHDRDAFVVCKSCGKALCLECVDKYNDFYICKDSVSCRKNSKIEQDNLLKNESGTFEKYLYTLFGAFLLSYIVVKTIICFILPCPLGFSLENLLILFLGLILLKKGIKK